MKKSIKLEKMTDVCRGKLTLRSINNEIIYYLLNNKPKRIIVDIQRTKDGYYTSVYIPNKDFNKKIRK